MVDVASIVFTATAFVLGLGHSLDPDHVVAVSTLLCNSTSLRKSVTCATAWGAGHSAVLLMVGLLVLGLRVAIPESVVQLFKFAAGVMLIALGILVLRPLLAHKLRNRELKVANSQTPTSPDAHNYGHSHVHKSALTGVLQGLAGSAAIMLVTLTTVNSLELGLVFILVFGAGVILGMVSIACLISSLLNYTASHIERVHEKIGAITGIISIGFGVFIVIQILLQNHI